MSEKVWGGVFSEATDRRMEEFTESVSFDRRVHAELDESVYEVLGVRQTVEATQSYGSSAPEQVGKQIEHWEQRLGKP